MIMEKIDYFTSATGNTALYSWPTPQPDYLVLLLHGYGEHMGRYHYLAKQLSQEGALVFGPDHQGHGLSTGERVLIADFAVVIKTIEQSINRIRQHHPTLPLVIIGHSMGGMLATRYAQLYASQLQALILSGPLLGEQTAIAQLANLAVIPDTPLDITHLSRDPLIGQIYASDPLVWHGPFKRPTLIAIKTLLAEIEQGANLGSLPTLWMHGQADKIVDLVTTQATLEKLRGNHFYHHTFIGARHEIFNETNKEEVIQQLIDFLNTNFKNCRTACPTC